MNHACTDKKMFWLFFCVARFKSCVTIHHVYIPYFRLIFVLIAILDSNLRRAGCSLTIFTFFTANITNHFFIILLQTWISTRFFYLQSVCIICFNHFQIISLFLFQIVHFIEYWPNIASEKIQKNLVGWLHFVLVFFFVVTKYNTI